jgi:hypothetical protein
MEVRIGIKDSARDLSFDASLTASQITDLVKKAIEGGEKLITMTDAKGSSFLIPTASISFVEVGAEEARRVGFIA